MNIDRNLAIQKAKAKLDEEARKGQQFARRPKLRLWKPTKGKNRVRILPPWTTEGINAAQFWREGFTHWVGDEDKRYPITCPVRTAGGPGGSCPLCQEYERLRATGDAVDIELAKNLRAQQRLYSNVVDLKDPVFTDADVADWQEKQENSEAVCPFVEGETKVQVWIYGPTILKQLLDYEQDGIFFWDLETGYDVIVVKEGEGLGTEYRVRIDARPSKFESKGESDLSDSMYNLDTILPYSSVDDMRAAISAPLPSPALKPAQRPVPVSGSEGGIDGLEKLMRSQLTE